MGIACIARRCSQVLVIVGAFVVFHWWDWFVVRWWLHDLDAWTRSTGLVVA